MIDCYGKAHDLCPTGKELMYILGDYICVRIDKDQETLSALYTSQGEEIMPMNKGKINLIEGEKDWIGIWTPPYRLFDVKNRVTYPGAVATGRHDDMFTVCNDSASYYINAVSRKKIRGEYDWVEDFHEGIARVRFSKDYYDVGFIDKKGNVVLRGSKNLELNEYCSEGVIGAYNKPEDYKEWFKGYIYNPLGHGGYVYNASDKMAADDYLILQWDKKADEAFSKEQYGTAKDYYYRVMMNKPDDSVAITSYGACLSNLGYYEEAIETYLIALDINPNYELAKKNLEITRKNLRIREEREEAALREQGEEEYEERSSPRSNTFWDALGNFANMLSSFTGGSNAYQSYSSFSSGYGSSSSGGASSGNYQSQYDRWAQRAESNYNSLTNLGYSATRKNGSKHGGTLQSMNGGNYVQMKKNLRDAQREMLRIRRTAARNGVTIRESPWETATVNY